MNKISSVNSELLLAFNKSIKAYKHKKENKEPLARKKLLNILRKGV